MRIREGGKQKLYTLITSGFLVIVIVFSPILNIPKAHAYPVEESGPALGFQQQSAAGTTKTAIASSISSIKDTLQASLMASLEIKEFAFDTVAWGLVNIALQEMIRSTTQWVNSGFNGSPAFITDLNGFMTDLGDRVAGDIIWGSKLAGLCAPFKLNIQLALEIQYNATHNFETQCRLSQVVDNMDNFFGGDFISGGWDGWFQMAMIPQNNPYGAMLESQAVVQGGVQNALGAHMETARWANGFLSVQQCGSNEFGPPHCQTVTPGVVVENVLNDAIGGPQKRLTIADEMNELLGSLFMQLASEALSGAGGLLGLTDSNYGSGDYFDRVRSEQNGLGQNAQVNTRAFDDIKKDEVEFRRASQSTFNLIEAARTYKNTTYGTSTKCASGALTTSLVDKRTNAQNNIDSATTLITEIDGLRAEVVALQDEATPKATTQAILTKYKAENSTQAIGLIMNKFMTLRSSARLHDPANTVDINLVLIPALKEEIKEFKKAIDTSCKVAPRIITPPVSNSSTTATST